jgi:DnaJ family protein C protein 7
MNQQCTQITPSVDALCSECPSVTFLKVIDLTCLSMYQLLQSVTSYKSFQVANECHTYLNLQVNVEESPVIAKAENVRIVPTFKIYKDGARVKEMICPSLHVLRYSVRHYAVSNS